jgi:formylglycine-generating enzyme required for sulfatase activity
MPQNQRYSHATTHLGLAWMRQNACAPPTLAVLQVPKQAFVPNPQYPECKHPGVVSRCRDGWCLIPPGCFIYGSEEGTPERGAVTEEQGPVTLSRAFLIGQFETTIGEWESLKMPKLTTLGLCTKEDCPVVGMDWYEAAQFANERSLRHTPPLQPCYTLAGCTKDKNVVECATFEQVAPPPDCTGYRLPTIAEFQYAAKAGTQTHTYAGDVQGAGFEACDAALLSPIAWYVDNAENEPHPDGLKLPNQFGLFDVLGNAMEWGSEPGRNSPPFPATDPFVHLPPGRGRVRLGGTYLSPVTTARASKLIGMTHRAVPFVGLRLVRTLSAAEAEE